MKNILFIHGLFLILFSFNTYAQDSKTISFEVLNSRIYSTKSTVSDNFNAHENGNLKILSMNGFKIQFKNTYLSNSKFEFRLRAGFERNLQKYELPYYQSYPIMNDIKNLHDFKAVNTNISFGIEKEIDIINDKFFLIIGFDAVARTLKSNSVLDIDLDEFYVPQNNDAILRFSLNSSTKGGSLVGQMSSFLEYRLKTGISFFAGAYLTPRFNTGYQYQVSSYKVVEENGVLNTYFQEDRSNNETLSIKYIQLSVGLNYSF